MHAPRSLVAIDLAAVAGNVRRLIGAAGGAEVWAVVKADAYGHGAADVGRAALAAGATRLCVATIGEARALRAALPGAALIAFLPLRPGEEDEAVALGCAAVVSTPEAWERARARHDLDVHVEVETGMGRWGLDKGVNIGIVLAQGALELALALFVAFFFYRAGASLASRLRDGLSRLLGESGPRLLSVAGNTVKSVVYGVLGTALVQAMLMLVGLLIAGVPNAVLLAFVTGITSPLPIGPPVVWLGAAAWLYATAGWGWAVFMLAWGLGLVSMADNVVRPLLISRGGTTPIVVTLLGILGGVIAFGFLGLFLGPTLLAVGYSLVSDWTARHPAAERPKQA